MKILVTGATGTVGTYVVKALCDLNEGVVVATSHPDKAKDMFENKVEAVHFDFTEPSTFDKALEGVDRVFLMRPPHLGKPEDLYPFIAAMKANGIKLVAFLSLMGVEKNTIPPHHKIEKYIESQDLPYVHVRPGFFMQNISTIHAPEIKENNEIFIPAGGSKCSFIDAKDIGLATATLLHDPETYKNTSHTLTGPEALDYYQVADILSRVTGHKISYRKPGFLKYRRHYIHKRGLDKAYVNVTVALYFMTRMGTAKAVTPTFKKITGKDPRSFEAFARDNKEAFLA